MSKKTQFTGSKNKIRSLSWTSPIYINMGKVSIKGTEIQRSYIPKLIGMGFTRKEISEITGLGHQLISDYYIKYKNKYEK
jgi:hypothetical protein